MYGQVLIFILQLTCQLHTSVLFYTRCYAYASHVMMIMYANMEMGDKIHREGHYSPVNKTGGIMNCPGGHQGWGGDIPHRK